MVLKWLIKSVGLVVTENQAPRGRNLELCVVSYILSSKVMLEDQCI